ncbi:MAG: PilZ domain-containing protein [Polyangiales bacterium]
MSESRAHRRYRVWLPIRVSSEGLEGVIAVSHDASVGGLMMSTPALGIGDETLEVGARVELMFALPPVDEAPPLETKVAGSVVRIEPNADDPEGPWPFRVAVRFDAPLAELEGPLSDIANELGKSK